jgi:hypothetical protein
VSRNLTGKPPTVPSDGKLLALMMGDPPTNGSLFSFGDKGSKVKRGGVVYGAMLRGRNFWAKLDTVMVSGGSLDWNITDEINIQALQF